jgi:hypothetical protein
VLLPHFQKYIHGRTGQDGSGRGVQAFRSMAWLGASERQIRTPRSEYDGSGGAAKQPSDGNGRPEGGGPRRSFFVHPC